MLKRLFNCFRSAACIALLALGVGLPLMSVNANAGSIPLAGQYFYEAEGTQYPYIGLQPGWSWHQYSIYFTKVFMDSNPSDNALGIFDYASVICALQCDASDPNFLSRRIDGLVTGNQYKLTFWAKGYWQNDIGEGFPDAYTYGNTKVSASVGSFQSAAIELLIPPASPNWQKIALNFTYKDASPSAVLSIIQNIVGPMTVGCVPCGTTLLFGGIALDDVTPTAPKLTVTKALSGNRGANDQFTVQILDGINVVNATTKSTTTGVGSTVDSGTGTTGPTMLKAGTSYKIAEVGSGNTSLGGYSSALACTNSTGTTVPTALNTAFTLSNNDNVSCTITNKAKPATLTVRQEVSGPLPVNIVAPYRFSYTGTNGWGTESISNPTKESFVSSSTKTLSAFNTATQLTITLPENRWSAGTFSCADTTAAASGNPAGVLATAPGQTSITIPAANVRPGATLRCTVILGHTTP